MNQRITILWTILPMGERFEFREISIKKGAGDWTDIDNGNVFSLVGSGVSTLEEQLKNSRGNAIYNDKTNLKADFVYTIAKDSVFSYSVLSDSLYFFDESMEKFRKDLKGEIIFASDTIIILHNTGVSPVISIKYGLEKNY